MSGRENYGVEIRMKNNFRDSIDDIRSLEIPSKNGRVTLEQVADISLENGPATINSENGVIRSAVQMNVQGVDLGSFVEQGREYIDQKLTLPE